MLILKNVAAVQLHPAKVQEGVDIAIENDVIVAIGDALTQRYPDASFKEMHGRIVMPGIVCSHNHFYSGLSRGRVALLQWADLSTGSDQEWMYIGYRSPCLSGVYRRVALHIARRIFKSWPARDDLF